MSRNRLIGTMSRPPSDDSARAATAQRLAKAARAHRLGLVLGQWRLRHGRRGRLGLGLCSGPQDVLDVVNMTGKLTKPFAGLSQVGAQVHLQWVIYFPWVPDQGKFRGEVIYSIRPL